jgi:hypothetical protein
MNSAQSYNVCEEIREKKELVLKYCKSIETNDEDALIELGKELSMRNYTLDDCFDAIVEDARYPEDCIDAAGFPEDCVDAACFPEDCVDAAGFRGVCQGTIPATPGGPDGSVRIGDATYSPKECGIVAGEHTNACFYTSVSNADYPAAVTLKEELTPLANEISKDFGVSTNFADKDAPAENEVIMALVILKRTPVCVYSTRGAPMAVTYFSADCVHEMIYLVCDGCHFRRLVRL